MLLSASSRKVALRCNMKFNLEQTMKKLNIPRPQSGKSALTGNVIHTILEYRALGHRHPLRMAKKDYPDYPEETKDQHCWKWVEITYEAYKRKYKRKNDFDVLELDGEKCVELHFKNNLNEYIHDEVEGDQGFIDRIIYIRENHPFIGKKGYEFLEAGQIWAVDIKTTKMDVYEDDWINQWESNIQFALYLQDLRQKYPDKNFKGVMIDGITHTKPKRKLNRLWFYDSYTPEKCEEIIKKSNDTIINTLENKRDRNFEACMDFGLCPHFSICRTKNIEQFTDEQIENLLIEKHKNNNKEE